MSDLEKHIGRIRDQLDVSEPATGHLDRFRKKLKLQDRVPVRSINFRHALQIAASIAIIAASGIWIVKTGKGSKKIAENQVVNEFRETTSYYARQVNARYENLATIDFSSAEEKEVLLEELSSMDRHYRDLLKEFDANPGDERVMNALIRHYQIKLQVMDQIIAQLEQLKNIKTEENEKSSI